jgi:predicted ester cyclase
MSAAQVTSNKATLSRLHDALNSGDEELISTTIDEIFDPDVRISTPLPIETTGPQALKQVWATLLRAYPDLHVTVEDLFGEQDRLVARNTVTGTHQGEYFGIPPTGKSVTYHEMLVVRFAGGRIAETWGVVDLLSQMQQLGAIPASSATAAIRSQPHHPQETGNR